MLWGERPYLEQGEITDPLTLTYCVDNGDDTRTELNRTTLGAVMSRFLDNDDLPARIPGRAKIVAAKLPQFAQKREALSGSRGAFDGFEGDAETRAPVAVCNRLASPACAVEEASVLTGH